MIIDKKRIRKRPSINPYIEAANMIYERLKWDLKLEAWKSRRRLKKIKDRYSGKKAVILCNGPSLLKSDLSLLKNTFTFGLNKINLLFDKSDFRPSCIVSVNKYAIEQNASFFNKTDIPLFLNDKCHTHIFMRKNIIFLHNSHRTADFARDCSMTIYQGSTVTYVAMQLAFHMGFKEVALIGCDHNFNSQGTPHEVVVSGQIDTDHFDPKYFSDGEVWQLPDLAGSEFFYSIAYDVFKFYDRRIFNATVGGKLELFPRVSLKQFLR